MQRETVPSHLSIVTNQAVEVGQLCTTIVTEPTALWAIKQFDEVLLYLAT